VGEVYFEEEQLVHRSWVVCEELVEPMLRRSKELATAGAQLEDHGPFPIALDAD
jgi:hypothetical protein